MVIRAGDYVEERLDGTTERGYRRELSIQAVSRQRGDAVVGAEGIVRPRRTELPTHTRYDFSQHAQQEADALLAEAGLAEDSDQEFYRLDAEDTYFVRFVEDPAVPEGSIGYVTPKPNLLHCGVEMNASAVGPDDGPPEATLSLTDGSAFVQADAAIAELVVLEAGEG